MADEPAPHSLTRTIGRVLLGLFLPSGFTLSAAALSLLGVRWFAGIEVLLGFLSFVSIPAMLVGAVIAARALAGLSGASSTPRVCLWLLITFPAVVVLSFPGCALVEVAGRGAR